MTAAKENDYIVIFNERNAIIGKIKVYSKDNFSKSEIIVDQKTFLIIRDQWIFKVLDEENIIYNIETNATSGDMKILELDKKIKGVFSLKWGTELIDQHQVSLLKISNKNDQFDYGNYDIKIENKDVSNIEIVLSLFGHLYGSQLQRNSVA